jgi:uncharacterized protein (DUF2147 family)
MHFTVNKRILVGSLLLLASFWSIISYAAITPVGVWKTIDDETGKPRSVVQIWQSNNQLLGRINQVYYRPGEGPSDVCKLCTGSFHNQRILGMTMLWGMMQQAANQWGGGYILDPQSGKVYRCQLTLNPNGKQLFVRGYLGTPLIGRTQTWYRVS